MLRISRRLAYRRTSVPSLFGALLPLAALGYTVLLGGTSVGELNPVLRATNAVIGGSFILLLILRPPPKPDLVDAGVILSAALFCWAGVFSSYPRQTLDSSVTVLALAAALTFGRGYLAGVKHQRLLQMTFMMLSLVITAVAAWNQVRAGLIWAAATEWSILPPVNLNLSGYAWGHRYDLTLLAVMLYPAWWTSSPSKAPRAPAIVVGVIVCVLLLLSGSRTLWLAVLTASIVVFGPYAVSPPRMSRAVSLSALLVLCGGVVVTGLAPSVLTRAMNTASLDWRVDMWVPLTELAASHAIVGLGPGSFPWALQHTNYFDTNSHAPLHPDSVPFQLLPEAGLLGITALALLLAVMASPLARSPSNAAKWALAVFAISCLGANPTSFGFLMVTALAWTALTMPRPVNEQSAMRRRAIPFRILTVAVASVVAGGYAATVAGAFAYRTASEAVYAGDVSRAVIMLDRALQLDPGLALYRRERGTAHLVAGDLPAAIRDLQATTRMNSADDTAWRALAIAQDEAGDFQARDTALAEALDRQRSDPANLLLLAHWQIVDGNDDAAVQTLTEVVQAWPWTAFSRGWSDLASQVAPNGEVIDGGLARWADEMPAPERKSDQDVWLAAMAGQTPMREGAGSPTNPLAVAVSQAIRCGPGIESTLRALDEDLHSRRYWMLRMMIAVQSGRVDGALERLSTVVGSGVHKPAANNMINPLNDTGRLPADEWGYRRPTIDWRETPIWLPDPDAGISRWVYYPIAAFREAGIRSRHPAC